MVNSEPLPTSKMEFFAMIVNSIEKNSILDVVIVIIRFWLQCRCTSQVTENL